MQPGIMTKPRPPRQARQAYFGIPLGALLILKKHRVDTVVVSYTNDHGGELGLVLQMERGKGREFGNMLKTHGIVVVDPPPDNRSDANKKTTSGISRRPV